VCNVLKASFVGLEVRVIATEDPYPQDICASSTPRQMRYLVCHQVIRANAASPTARFVSPEVKSVSHTQHTFRPCHNLLRLSSAARAI
jgi:hypothetical protein